HGSTRVSNRTSLQDIGSFGFLGTKGFLQQMISQLSWSSSLRLVMNSCSTFCGSEPKVSARVRSLFRDFHSVGVQEMSIWGATQPMTSAPGEYMPNGLRESMPATSARIVGGLVGSAAAAATYHLTDGGILPSIVAMALLYFPTKFFLYEATEFGSRGRLIFINSTTLKAYDVDASDKRLTDLSCEW